MNQDAFHHSFSLKKTCFLVISHYRFQYFQKKQKLMQIAVDIRWYDDTTPYGRCVLKIVCDIATLNSENGYIVYWEKPLICKTPENLKFHPVHQKKWNFFDQRSFKKTLENHNSHLTIFFDECIPFGYKKDYIVFIPSLQEVFFPKLGFLKKLLHQKALQWALKNAHDILCFEKNTALELNERLNIKEEKIQVLYPFFISKKPTIDTSDIKLDIKAKYNLTKDFILYDAGNDSNSNFERVLKILQKLSDTGKKVNLLVISEDTTADVELRKKVLEFKIEKSIFFIGRIEAKDEVYYYTQATGVIFPTIYSSFPFAFARTILYQAPIITSELKSIQEIMEDSITYFNSRSTNEAAQQVTEFLQERKQPNLYSSLNKRLSPENTVKSLLKVIESWEKRL